AQVAIACLDIAPLLIELVPAQRGTDLVRLAAAIDRHAAVALLGGGVAKPGAIARRQEFRPDQLVFLGLGLLHAEHVGLLLGEPIEEALAGCRAQAVGVEADDAHGLSRRGTKESTKRTASDLLQPEP